MSSSIFSTLAEEENKNVIPETSAKVYLNIKEQQIPANIVNINYKLQEFWPKLLPILLSDPRLNDILNTRTSCTKQWLEFVIDNWLQPKSNKLRIRAVLAILAYDNLNPNATDHERHLSLIIAAAQELMTASNNLAISIVDDTLNLDTIINSHYRKGKIFECYKNNLKTLAMNDVFLLNVMASRICFQAFLNEKFFKKYLKQAVIWNSKNMLGFMYAGNCKYLNNIETCTFSMYLSAIKPQLCNTFVCPIILAMILAGIEEKGIYDSVEAVGIKIGLLHQLQVEYTKLFQAKTAKEEEEEVTTELTGITKTSRKKLPTWFEVQAYQLAKTDKQNAILIENFSSKVPERNLRS